MEALNLITRLGSKLDGFERPLMFSNEPRKSLIKSDIHMSSFICHYSPQQSMACLEGKAVALVGVSPPSILV